MITKVDALPSGRPETGPMQFGDDWPGVFIRGDNALLLVQSVKLAASMVKPEFWAQGAQLEGLAELLQSCSVGDTGWPPK